MASKSLVARMVSRMSVMGRLLQKFVDLFVRGLRKIFVPEADRLERLGGAETYDVDAFVAKLFAGLRGGNRNGDDDRARSRFLQRFDRGAHRRAGGQPVV